ncbi:MAG: Si-specific NAD(P)(+) transhydrogenase [Planctomycetaceae bacterium]|nr:Si-specific NAD(P)(+) transhydrogenase [Planctomycetaceae bacterium]
MEAEYDVVVIGTGPGGEGAAMQAVKHGRTVAAVERDLQIGGSCTHRGTIPSKALRYAIFQLMEMNNNPLMREQGVSINCTLAQLQRRAKTVIEQQVRLRTMFYDRNDVPVFRGEARLLDEHTIEVVKGDGGREVVTGKHIVIATGSRPYQPADIDFSHSRVFDSDTVLRCNLDVKSITIFGAGVIGCEYASMFRNLEMKVNLVNNRDRLLDFLDEEIVDALSYNLRERGVLIRHREEFDRVDARDDCVVVSLKSGKQLKTDIFLWAAGRTGNSDGMNLEAHGIQPDSRGNIKVNEHLQTTVPHIYAVGDVIGPPALASAAYTQGRYAASHIIGAEMPRLVLDIPTGIYTSPEISSLGKTERELTESKVPYEVGHSQFRSLARAQITGRTVGMLKILFHRETLEILGIHCFGATASEIIHIGQAVMAQPAPHNTLLYFINTTFNYPTMAEAYRVAALNGYNRLF